MQIEAEIVIIHPLIWIPLEIRKGHNNTYVLHGPICNPMIYSSENWSFPTEQIGQNQSSGKSLKGVPGGILLSGSPFSGS